MKPCTWDSRLLYDKLIDPLRARARELGYALAVHGTLKRDIDLIACPWIPEAVDPSSLAHALYEVVVEVNDGAAFIRENDPWHRSGCPGHKPHGRLVWTIHLGGGPYIDLSVMPRGGADDGPYRLWMAALQLSLVPEGAGGAALDAHLRNLREAVALCSKRASPPPAAPGASSPIAGPP